MSSKINITEIVADHFRTLRNYGENRPSPIDITVFTVCPLIAGLIVFLNGFGLGSNLVNALINASAIFVGLLLNLLMLMFDQQNKAKSRLEAVRLMAAPPVSGEEGSLKLRISIISEVVSNISYTVLVCVVSLCSLLAMAARVNDNTTGYISLILSALNVAVWFNIILTIVMIIKRVFKLFKA